MPKRTRNASMSRSVRRRLFNGSSYSSGMRSGARVEGGNRKVTVRCRLGTTGTANITVPGLCCAAGCVATATTAAYSMSRAVKVVGVKVKSPSPAVGIVETVYLQFGNSTSFDARKTYVNSSNTEGKSAYISARPEPGSASAGWNDASNDICEVTGGAGTIIEITYYISQVKSDNPGWIYPWVLAGLVVGRTYYPSPAQNAVSIS